MPVGAELGADTNWVCPILRGDCRVVFSRPAGVGQVEGSTSLYSSSATGGSLACRGVGQMCVPG